jgi:hypothetical protein
MAEGNEAFSHGKGMHRLGAAAHVSKLNDWLNEK